MTNWPPAGRAIWLLTSKDRPEMCAQVLEAAAANGSSYGVVWADHGDRQADYRDLPLPAGWGLHLASESERSGLGASLDYCFGAYPHAFSYGWLADDTLPRTNGWAEALEGAAGSWCLSYADDRWLSREGPQAVKEGSLLTSGLVFGGQLVRAANSWKLPLTARQACIDLAWVELVRPLGLFRYVGEVLVEHQSYRNQKRLKDPTDSLSDPERIGEDYRAFLAWREAELPAIVRRLLARLPLHLLREAPTTAANRILLEALADAREHSGSG